MSLDRGGALGIPEEWVVQSRRGELRHPESSHRDLLARARVLGGAFPLSVVDTKILGGARCGLGSVRRVCSGGESDRLGERDEVDVGKPPHA